MPMLFTMLRRERPPFGGCLKLKQMVQNEPADTLAKCLRFGRTIAYAQTMTAICVLCCSMRKTLGLGRALPP